MPAAGARWKAAVLEALQRSLQQALDTALLGAERARDEATHAETRSEGKYDTRGLEASYLAAGQGERVMELRQALGGLHGVAHDATAVGSLVRVSGTWYFMLPSAGGASVTVEGVEVRVLTPRSPLGEVLLGLSPGDIVELAGRKLAVDDLL